MASTKIRDSQVGQILEVIGLEGEESLWQIHVELRERVFPSRKMYLRVRQMDNTLIERTRDFVKQIKETQNIL